MDGDEHAFMDFVNQYSPYLFAVVYPIIGEQHSTEDVLQESFLQIYRSFPQYKHKGLKTWIARIATNKAIDWKRKNAKEKAVPLNEEINLQRTSLTEPGKEQPETAQLQLEEKEQLIEICRSLPLIYQETIEKFYFQDKSYAEIAHEQGVSVKTVESRLYRAKQLLKKRWEEDDNGAL